MAPSFHNLIRSVLPTCIVLVIASAGVVPASPAQTQRFPVRSTGAGSQQALRANSVPALFISDVHFDPFHDPAKAKQLSAAPVSEWEAIFHSAASPNQRQAFDALQKQCKAKGVDTPPALLQSAVAAMSARQPDAKFMVVSGDLVVHDFTCRYKALVPDGSPDDYQAFVLKTLSFVIGELHAAFPGMPIYTALGNNDSGCGDYQLDPDSGFFAGAGSIFASVLPVADQHAAKKEFSAEGNYSVLMAAPMRNTRLVVLNDTFLSPKYKLCGGMHDAKGSNEEVEWLKRQLADARRLGQRVWVVGHIPPGIDPYSTAEKFRDICGGQDPVTFMTSDQIPDLLVEHADIVKLAIFAHTHMDEIRLLRPQGTAGTSAPAVAVKMIPSVSPVHGNNPTFTVANINPASATMQDYTVIAASNLTGDDTKWAPEYNYARAYHQTEFSPAALKSMIDKFRMDNVAILPESENYLRNYFPGNRAAELSPFWMQYTCALNNYTGKGYAACVCRTGLGSRDTSPQN